MQLDIPPGEFAGYIFDLDGTLIDSMPAHFRAWDKALRQLGLKVPLDEDLFYSLGGVQTTRVAEIIEKHYGIDLDPAEVLELKERLYLSELPAVKPIEPVVAFARRVAVDHPVSVATGGLPLIALPALAAAGLDSIFKIVITPLDVPPGRSKPAPDMYLLAARRMGVPPEKCLVFEDAALGIEAARAAGMKFVWVPSRIR